MCTNDTDAKICSVERRHPNAFNRVIGYDSIKTELEQICDMIKNPIPYESLGAKLPKGILLYGAPGLGKSLMAECFIEESNLPAFTVRRGNDSIDCVSDIMTAFEEAAENTPSVVLLDDMDKYANEDSHHRDAEEYVAVQSGIDGVKDKEVLVLATVNDLDKLPHSLTRSGRFDRKIEFDRPTGEESRSIISYYLSDKPVADDVDMEDLTRMISYSSCAELESILNDAAIRAAFSRKNSIHMEDILETVLCKSYNAPTDDNSYNSEEKRIAAVHEAGHVVVSELLAPGSVGFATIRGSGSRGGGFIHSCMDMPSESRILVGLAGKSAVELLFGTSVASGSESDIKQAVNIIRRKISKRADCGFGLLDVSYGMGSHMSENLNSRSEAIVYSELERFSRTANELLIKNRGFLDAIIQALLEKKTLLYSDIQEIKNRENICVRSA